MFAVFQWILLCPVRCTNECHRHTEDGWLHVMWWRLQLARCREWKGEVQGRIPAERRIRRTPRQTDSHPPVQTETCLWGRTWFNRVQAPLYRTCARDGEWGCWCPACRRPLIDQGGSGDFKISCLRRSRYHSGAEGGPSLWSVLYDRRTDCC